MPGSDLVIDPVTRDFVDDGAGDWEETTTLMPQIRHQVLDHRGLWFADPEAGSDVYTIPRKANRITFTRVQDAVRDALQVFVDAGQAEDLSVEITRDQYGRLCWESTLVDAQHGELDLTSLLGFGVGETSGSGTGSASGDSGQGMAK
jgi:phage gp46-like protein